MSSVRPNPEGACFATSAFTRFGVSDSPLQFDVSGLAQPSRDGDTWKLGPGSVGDGVALQYDAAATRWTFREDPHFAPFLSVLAALPPLPPNLSAPPTGMTLESISHWTESGKQVSDPGVQWTTIGQTVTYAGCP